MTWHELTEDERTTVDLYIAGDVPWQHLTSAARRYLTTPTDGPWYGHTTEIGE